MSLFPFLILVTALAGFFRLDGPRRRGRAASCCEAWPDAGGGADRHAKSAACCTSARGDLLTIGVALAIYFASSGIESLRIGLNRAYGVVETRSWWLLRLESIGYVLIARGRRCWCWRSWSCSRR